MPGAIREAEEWLLKQNTKYLFKATSHEDANELLMVLRWYEYTNLH